RCRALASHGRSTADRGSDPSGGLGRPGDDVEIRRVAPLDSGCDEETDQSGLNFRAVLPSHFVCRRCTNGDADRFRDDHARTASRTIFAERVFGNAATNFTASGLNALPNASETRARNAARSCSSGSIPGRSTTKHQIFSPFTSSGTPTAADSATAGWPARI